MFGGTAALQATTEGDCHQAVLQDAVVLANLSRVIPNSVLFLVHEVSVDNDRLLSAALF